jgi:hypothetical protein
MPTVAVDAGHLKVEAPDGEVEPEGADGKEDEDLRELFRLQLIR